MRIISCPSWQWKDRVPRSLRYRRICTDIHALARLVGSLCQLDLACGKFFETCSVGLFGCYTCTILAGRQPHQLPQQHLHQRQLSRRSCSRNGPKSSTFRNHHLHGLSMAVATKKIETWQLQYPDFGIEFESTLLGALLMLKCFKCASFKGPTQGSWWCRSVSSGCSCKGLTREEFAGMVWSWNCMELLDFLIGMYLSVMICTCTYYMIAIECAYGCILMHILHRHLHMYTYIYTHSHAHRKLSFPLVSC